MSKENDLCDKCIPKKKDLCWLDNHCCCENVSWDFTSLPTQKLSWIGDDKSIVNRVVSYKPPKGLTCSVNWEHIANENNTWTFPMLVDVRYGIGTSFKFLFNITGTFTFDNILFGGDPAPGVIKQVWSRCAQTIPIIDTCTIGWLLLNPVAILNFVIPVDLRYGFVNDYKYLFNVSGVLNIRDSTFGFVSSSSDTRLCWYRCTKAQETIEVYSSGLKNTAIPLTDISNNPTTGEYLSTGLQDEHYLLTSSSCPAVPFPNCYVNQMVNGVGMIGIFPKRNAPHGFYRYETVFDLTGFDLNTVVLNLRYQMLRGGINDISGLRDVLINNTSTGITGIYTANWYTGDPFVINNNFISGNNSLIFVIEITYSSNNFAYPLSWQTRINGTGLINGINTTVPIFSTAVSSNATPLTQIDNAIPRIQRLQVGDMDPHYHLLYSEEYNIPSTPFHPYSLGVGKISQYFPNRDVPSGLYTYQTQFDLSNFITTSVVLYIKVSIETAGTNKDNLTDIIINNNSTQFNHIGTTSTWSPIFQIPNTFFIQGVNTLDFLIQNLTDNLLTVQFRLSGMGIPR